METKAVWWFGLCLVITYQDTGQHTVYGESPEVLCPPNYEPSQHGGDQVVALRPEAVAIYF